MWSSHFLFVQPSWRLGWELPAGVTSLYTFYRDPVRRVFLKASIFAWAASRSSSKDYGFSDVAVGMKSKRSEV